MKKAFIVFALVAAALGAVTARAQTNDPAITATRVMGKVTEINGPAGQLTVKTDAGSTVLVGVNEKTSYLRMPPGETDRAKGVPIGMTDIAVGDGVYARGYVAEDRKSVPAQQVIVVAQSDIAKKQEKERAEWRVRGLSGIVESLNPQTKEITVKTRTPEGPKAIVVPVTDKVKMRRYTPDSVKFSDARKSSFDDLKVGDQLRAKGDKSEDGARFTPDEIVTGAFRTIGGSVTSVDPATGEIKISDIQSKQPVTVVVSKDSTIKRIPADFMQRGPGGPGAGGPPPQGGGGGGGGGARPAGPGGPPQGGPGGPGGGGGPDIQRLIESAPATTLAELKAGEMILISSTTGADPSRVTAITLVAGVEPVFQMLQASQGGPANRPPNLGTINIGIGGP